MVRPTARIELTGIPLSPGTAWGYPCFYCEAIPSLTINRQTKVDEANRLGESLEWMIKRLEMLAVEAEAKLDSEIAAVFRVQQMILKDPNLQQRLFEIIVTQGLNAERAVENQLAQYQTQLQALETEYLRQRAADVAEIKQGLLGHLRRVVPGFHCKEIPHCNLGECHFKSDHIVVATELTSHLLMEADCHVRGYLVEKGGPHSHAAILARALGLPAISGLKELQQIIPRDTKILIDGETGRIFLNPSPKIVHRWRHKTQFKATVSEVTPAPELQVMANIDYPADVEEAHTFAAEGIGLYRTETEFLAKARLLTEAEQTERYTQVANRMAEQPVYIRLLDLGADKAAPWLGLPQEQNPALGCRGARLLLSRPEILRTQARALAQAAKHRPICVVYPMIADLEQFQKLRVLFDSALKDLPSSLLLHGIMFEIPAACLQAQQFFEEIDFGCIGTNDLVQYLFATDRMSENAEYESFFNHPVLWNLIKDLVKSARKAAKPLSLCGELGGNPHFTHRLIEAGITAVSTNPKQILAVRQAARGAPYFL
jgi:phosphoenolpyruvate-protein phosphotransferase (PTS system enzyme I)